MITVKVKALGQLKQKIEANDALELSDSQSIYSLLDAVYGLVQKETSRYSFVVNGKIQKGTYLLQDKDELTVLRMGGAG